MAAFSDAEKQDLDRLGQASPDSDLTGSGQASVDSQVDYSPEEEKALVRKVDWALLPGLTFLYLLSFLDRSNVGLAKLQGLMKDIGLADKPEAYNTSLALYFVGYVLFEIPANMVLKKLNPRVVLPTLTILWGITAALQCLVKDEAGFYVARFFLGVSEAGLFPGIVFVLSCFYARKERTLRVSLFFGGAALAGAFGGILGFGIGKIEGGALESWGYLFLIEGLFTVLVGVSAYWWIPASPSRAKFLTERQRAILVARLRLDGGSTDEEPFSWQGVWDAFKDPFVHAYGWLFHCFAFGLYSLSLFLPTIVAQLGYASWRAQLLTVPIYALAFLAILVFCWASHRVNQRGSAIAVAGGIAIVGYIVLIATHTAGARLAGAFLAVGGIYAANALLLSWPSENVSPQTKRAVTSGNQIFIGDIGAITGSLVYRPSLSKNFYRLPHGVAILFTGLGCLLALSLSFGMHRANRTGNVGRAERVEKKGEEPKGDRRRGYEFQI
ncbi:MFS general substrate transporter [Rhodotorula diobovata]|uniref:MFS general substrate transporter n=1 Tax=Rhodotorula diobovata TaxID=5288 RepID=A0A5C5FQ20_9BASI|nr:MFS general substrate transporter [Rhodotorula diobovata]